MVRNSIFSLLLIGLVACGPTLASPSSDTVASFATFPATATAMPSATTTPTPLAMATAVAKSTMIPTVVVKQPAPGEMSPDELIPPSTPTPTRVPVIPQRGDIVAETTEGKYIVIRHSGGEEEIDQATFQVFARDASVTVDHYFRLSVSDGSRVLNIPLDSKLRSGGTVALGDRKKVLIDHLVAVDILGLYAAVVQNHREIILFEAVDAHHQGVIYEIPERFVGIESIFWGTVPPRDTDILLVLRETDGKPGIYWLSPGAHIYAAPAKVQQDCYLAPRLLTDCLMRYNRSLRRDITLVRDNAFHVSVVW